MKTSVNLPPRPTRIKIDGRTGKILKNEINTRSNKPKPKNRLDESGAGQTVVQKDGGRGEEKKTEAGLNGIDDALNKAIENAAIKAIEENPSLIQDAVADLIAKKISNKLKQL